MNGQQAWINLILNETPILNRTTAPSNRTRGYSEMAADVVVTETSLTDSASSNLMTQKSARRRFAANDGRVNRTHRVNVDLV